MEDCHTPSFMNFWIQGTTMKRLLAATAVLGLSTLPSLAADIAPRAYNKAPMMADPGFNWSGFYAGVNLGGG